MIEAVLLCAGTDTREHGRGPLSLARATGLAARRDSHKIALDLGGCR